MKTPARLAAVGLLAGGLLALTTWADQYSPPHPYGRPGRLCPTTPMTRNQILGHSGTEKDCPDSEGSARQHMQDDELNFAEIRRQSQQIASQYARQQPFWTPERRKRAAEECVLHESDAICDASQVIANQQAAIALGKALFWDMRVGSDGQTACASCHFRAGADPRPRSFGMAQRMLRPCSPGDLIAADGSELSEPLDAERFLHYTENRWRGMLDFSQFYRDAALRALRGATSRLQRLKPGLTEAEQAELREQRDLMVLKPGAGPEIREAVAALDAQLNGPLSGAKPGASDQPVSRITPIKTLIELAEVGLAEVGLAESKLTPTGAALAAVPPAPDAGGATEGVSATGKTARRRLAEFLSRTKEVERANFQDQPATQPGGGDQGGAGANPGGQSGGLESVVQSAVCPDDAPDCPDPNTPFPDANATWRQALGRNAPTVVNAALYERLFHDARASNVFNGYDHLGDDAGRDGYGKWVLKHGCWHRVLVRIPNAPLASQATAPLLSTTEMSWYGRQYHHVARKLLAPGVRPLQSQLVSCTDSVLGRYVSPLPGEQAGMGLQTTYRDLFRQAFRPEFVSDQCVPAVAERDGPTGQPLRLSQLEANFSLLWGLAIQAYEQTLISGQSPLDEILDRTRRGEPQAKDLATQQALWGLKVFQEHACADCHLLPEFAGATYATLYGPLLEFEGPLDAINADEEQNGFVEWQQARRRGSIRPALVESMFFRPNLANRLYDGGIYNLGVTTDVPTQDGFDPGNGGEVGLDLVSKGGAIASTANAFGSGLFSDVLLREVPVMYSRARRFDEQRSVALGAFKTATLRNIELTAPYFHDGSHKELKDVMEHYEKPLNNLNTTNRLLNAALIPEPPNPIETDVPESPVVDQYQMSPRDAVIHLMKMLTDPRVKHGTPPFDGPSLLVPVCQEVDAVTGRTRAALMRPAPKVCPLQEGAPQPVAPKAEAAEGLVPAEPASEAPANEPETTPPAPAN